MEKFEFQYHKKVQPNFESQNMKKFMEFLPVDPIEKYEIQDYKIFELEKV
jgi:hypothetical protein